MATSLSVGGASGELADGWWRACMMSLTPAMTNSMEKARGIMPSVGNHSRVLQMRPHLVSHTQSR
jgi:hypothetical protein